jgi:hypothetical protein
LFGQAAASKSKQLRDLQPSRVSSHSILVRWLTQRPTAKVAVTVRGVPKWQPMFETIFDVKAGDPFLKLGVRALQGSRV